MVFYSLIFFCLVTETIWSSKYLHVPKENIFAKLLQSLSEEMHAVSSNRNVSCSFLYHCFHYYERLKACGKNNINIIAIYAEGIIFHTRSSNEALECICVI